MANIDLNPPVNRSMRELDRSFFKKTIPVLAAQVDSRRTGELLRASALRRNVLDIPKITNVIRTSDNDDGKRLILLDVADVDQLPVEAKDYLSAQGAQLRPYSVELGYDYWSADQILRAILPLELGEGSPTAFSINGHIAHMNLRDEYLPYRFIIGQLILDKNKTIRTVVNKLDIIDTEFRFFKMEVLAGEPDFIIKHNESNCTFTLDFSTVYWNSRLAHEHERLVNLFTKPNRSLPGSDKALATIPLIADVFAGVGPFAIPAAKRGAIVYANDLNEESTKWMEVNVKNNKVVPRVRVSTLDGRQFINEVVQTAWTTPFPPEAYTKPLSVKERRSKRAPESAPPGTDPSTDIQPSDHIKSKHQLGFEESLPLPPPGHDSRRICHFVMNLPDTALEFLDAFCPSFERLRELYGEEARRVYATMPMVHVHCFTRELEEDNARKDILQRAEIALGCAITEDILLHHLSLTIILR
ncbi:TRNA (guanine(37)-N1)-methyltransferase [Ceratobasidium theobromae]|uniref:tRNA (guanine(37)-N1)-methyltransferase n=1 Tax=Ceratobasidium theobromae TaxID=1582974 RepID=A0A5N5QDH4_9AGAM|nr:TRNA (guanine(37)-N1)-methyltransferase [Ceratobasidium theobromae]